MGELIPVHEFEAIYLVDICESLLKIARKRIISRGWKNVHLICQDASTFTLPGIDRKKGGKGVVDLITFSYSLSMAREFIIIL